MAGRPEQGHWNHQEEKTMTTSRQPATRKRSTVWALLMKYQADMADRCLPYHSRGRKVYNTFVKGQRILIQEGWRSAWANLKTYLESRWRGTWRYSEWIEQNEPSVADLLNQKIESRSFPYTPCISIITPVFNISPEILECTLQSVIDQTYGNWELCVAEGNSENPEVRNLLKRNAESDQRIKVQFLDENIGISGNSNTALSMATGEFVLFLDHDDLLAPFALYEVVNALNQHPPPDLIYSDRDIVSEDGKTRSNPLFKPDWSPELMLSVNYLAHVCVIRKEILDTIGQFKREIDGAQDWDLFFRVTENTDRIVHIPKILYHWRSVTTSCATRGQEAKPYVTDAQRAAIEGHLKRRALQGRATINPSGWGYVRWDLPVEKMVSIIIPTKNLSLLKCCLESLFSQSDYTNYEILVIDTGLDASGDPGFIHRITELPNVKIIEYHSPFNYSAVNNLGSRHAAGEIFLFLNDDIKVISPGWLRELVSWSLQDKIGVVGAKLLHPGGTIQHAGVILGLTGFAGHIFSGSADHVMGMFGSTDWYRDYYAVTGACMMVAREIFEEVGGFHEQYTLCGSDVEFCLRVHAKGYRIVYTPCAILEHLEAASRGTDIPKGDFSLSYDHYVSYIERGDPYFNPNLSYWSCIPALRKGTENTPIGFMQGVLKK